MRNTCLKQEGIMKYIYLIQEKQKNQN